MKYSIYFSYCHRSTEKYTVHLEIVESLSINKAMQKKNSDSQIIDLKNMAR